MMIKLDEETKQKLKNEINEKIKEEILDVKFNKNYNLEVISFLNMKYRSIKKIDKITKQYNYKDMCVFVESKNIRMVWFWDKI